MKQIMEQRVINILKEYSRISFEFDIKSEQFELDLDQLWNHGKYNELAENIEEYLGSIDDMNNVMFKLLNEKDDFHYLDENRKR